MILIKPPALPVDNYLLSSASHACNRGSNPLGPPSYFKGLGRNVWPFFIQRHLTISVTEEQYDSFMDVLITGSFNFTKAAEEKNAENLLILKRNKPLVEPYIRNFGNHKGHTDAYVGRMSR